MFSIIIQKDVGGIVFATSKKFSDVPKHGFVFGAILINRSRYYVNRGTENIAVWAKIQATPYGPKIRKSENLGSG